MSGATRGYELIPVDYGVIPGWDRDDPRSLFPGMARCLAYIKDVKPYRSGSFGLSAEDLRPLLEAAGEYIPRTAADARLFFQHHCLPVLIRHLDGSPGFVTAFYEPEVDVASQRDSVWVHPFYYRPPDLIDVDDANRPPDMDSGYSFGWQTGTGIRPFPDRKMIDQGLLEGRGLEIAWARSKVDIFFAHVQGAARLRYPDGRVRRITYAAKAGHAFTGIGKVLVERGEIAPDQISMQAIRQWLQDNPTKVDELLWRNRSYIFFRDADVADDRLGPVAAAKVPLLPGRSLAVDRSIHTFGVPFFVHAPTLTHLDNGCEFARLMLALDTGSAIVGPSRGDIFTGSGSEAGEQAGTVRNQAAFYVLLPKAAAASLLTGDRG